MVAILKPETSEEQILHLKKWLENNGIELHITRGRSRIIASLTGDTSDMDIDLIRSFDMVENVQRIQEPFKKTSRKFHNGYLAVDIDGVKIGGGNFQIIAGPCSVENEEQICYIAECVKKSGAGLLRGGAFKPRLFIIS